MARFHKDKTIFEALQGSPACKVLDGHGMACRLCAGVQSESLAAGVVSRQVAIERVAVGLNRGDVLET